MKKSRSRRFKDVGEYAEFLSLAYHQVKNPLTSMRGYIQLLDKQLENKDKVKEYIEKVKKQSELVIKLVQNLSLLNKIQKEKDKNNLEIVNLETWLQKYIEGVKLINPEREFVVKGEGKKRIIFNREYLDIIMGNVVSNALKFSPSSTPIVVTLTEEKNQIKICVEDRGIGIEPSLKSDVFLPFSKLYFSRQEEYRGAGLGLFLSSQLVKLYKGSMWAEKCKGATQVCFAIPASQKL